MIHCCKKPWDHYRNTHVRNLAWCLLSPSLLASTPEGHDLLPALSPSEHHNWLTQLDQQPEPLLAHMQQCKSPRIGLVFEHYWHFFWQAQLGGAMEPPWSAECRERRWLKNLQVNHPKTHRTLGEADFITYLTYHQQPSSRLLHRELAVKFYLGFPVPDTPQESPPKCLWLGPNCIDRLDIKLAQMSNKQLQLLHHPEAQNALPPHWQGLPVDSQIVLRGQLFYPAHRQDFSADEAPLNQNHLRGFWYYLEGLLNSIDRHEEVVILNKSDWFCTPALKDQTHIIEKKYLAEELAPYLSDKEAGVLTEVGTQRAVARPLMLSVGHSSTQSSGAARPTQRRWQEARRIFVVPSHWPDTSLPSFKT